MSKYEPETIFNLLNMLMCSTLALCMNSFTTHYLVYYVVCFLFCPGIQIYNSKIHCPVNVLEVGISRQ